MRKDRSNIKGFFASNFPPENFVKNYILVSKKLTLDGFIMILFITV